MMKIRVFGSSIAERPNLKDHHIDQLLKSHYSVKSVLANRHDLKNRHIDSLITDQNIKVRQDIAENPIISDDHIDRLIKDRSKYVRHSVAKNQNLNINHIKSLSRQKDFVIKILLDQNPIFQKRERYDHKEKQKILGSIRIRETHRCYD